MIHFLQGIIEELTPTHIVMNCNGIGYMASISLKTYEDVLSLKEGKIFTQPIIREDAHLLYGFSTEIEKKMFNYLISVNGVGPASAMMMLSTLSIAELTSAIANGQSGLLQKVKGIGGKTAERIIIDLKDKVLAFDAEEKIIPTYNKTKIEALNAVEVLGIPKKMAEKKIDSILQNQPNIELEVLIKETLKSL